MPWAYLGRQNAMRSMHRPSSQEYGSEPHGAASRNTSPNHRRFSHRKAGWHSAGIPRTSHFRSPITSWLISPRRLRVAGKALVGAEFGRIWRLPHGTTALCASEPPTAFGVSARRSGIPRLFGLSLCQHAPFAGYHAIWLRRAHLWQSVGKCFSQGRGDRRFELARAVDERRVTTCPAPGGSEGKRGAFPSEARRNRGSVWDHARHHRARF